MTNDDACSATACSSLPWPSGPRSPRPAAPSASTARPTTFGAAASSATASRSSVRASVGGRSCQTRCRRWSSSASSRSRSPLPASAPGGWPRSSAARSGARSRSPTPPSGACCAATGSRPARRCALVAGYRAPYEPPREPEPERHVEAERPGELVGMDCFSSGAFRAPRARSGS